MMDFEAFIMNFAYEAFNIAAGYNVMKCEHLLGKWIIDFSILFFHLGRQM